MMFRPTEEDLETIRKLHPFGADTWLATWFGLGFFNPAPGTWGSFGALPFGIIFLIFWGWPGLLLAAIVIFTVGLWAAQKFEEKTGIHDSKMVVIDEVAGQWLALIPAGLNPILILLGFILFRLFDIAKPWPCSWFDQKLTGKWGVMMDDMVAGLYAALVLIGVRYAGFG